MKPIVAYSLVRVALFIVPFGILLLLGVDMVWSAAAAIAVTLFGTAFAFRSLRARAQGEVNVWSQRPGKTAYDSAEAQENQILYGEEK